MSSVEELVDEAVASSGSRTEAWIRFVRGAGVRRMAEVGVYRGEFAAEILGGCPSVETYYMIDPWRRLPDWNKPANAEDERFETLLRETESRTEFAAARRVILRGKTTEVVDRLPDGGLDLAYIDGDHTLRGIAIDLIRLYPKVRDGGFIGGDDFCETVWQHPSSFEPTLVFPFAVYFAEAVGVPITALPHDQFLISKDPGRGFAFRNLTGRYRDTQLGAQLDPGRLLRLKLSERWPWLGKLARALRGGGSRGA